MADDTFHSEVLESGLQIGQLCEDWSGDAQFFEYSQASDPIGGGLIPRVPIERFPAALHEKGPTRIIPLDLAGALGVDTGPLTSPALCASFICVVEGEHILTDSGASSELYYVLRGTGFSVVDDELIEWQAGDFMTLPARCAATHHATRDTTIYWVTDEPLLRYLGATATTRRFRPTKYDGHEALAELARVAYAPNASEQSRVSILLANACHPMTRTVTHTLWAMLGLVPAGEIQRPHRHQSVALDLITACQPGCYTLVGNEIDAHGQIADPVRVAWEPGGAFVTPPGMWHAHHNESGADAYLIPIQDAGLQTYLRSLDIRFT